MKIMKSMFKIIQDTPYCSNCGESDWKKSKNGKLYCVYCGHPMILHTHCDKMQFKEHIKKELEKRR